MKIPSEYKYVLVKHSVIIDEETGKKRPMTWQEWIKFVIKPQINKHKEEHFNENHHPDSFD